MRRILILLLATGIIGFGGLAVTGQQLQEEGVLDLGVSATFFEGEEDPYLLMRADTKQFGLPTVIEIKPEAASGGRIILQEANLGIKYLEPFGLTDTYIGTKAGLNFPASSEVTFEYGDLEVFVGTAFKLNEFNTRIRPEFGVQDPLSKDRIYKGTLTFQYVF